MTLLLNLTAHICRNIRNCVTFVEKICLRNRITDDPKVIVKMKGNTYFLRNYSAILQHETRTPSKYYVEATSWSSHANSE